MATYGILWQLMATYCNLWQLMTILDIFDIFTYIDIDIIDAHCAVARVTVQCAHTLELFISPGKVCHLIFHKSNFDSWAQKLVVLIYLMSLTTIFRYQIEPVHNVAIPIQKLN